MRERLIVILASYGVLRLRASEKRTRRDSVPFESQGKTRKGRAHVRYVGEIGA